MDCVVLTLTSAIEERLEAERVCVDRGITNYLPLPASAIAA